MKLKGVLLLLLASLASSACADSVFDDGYDGSPDDCPLGRQMVEKLCFRYTFTGPACTSLTDITTFESVWGRNTPSGTQLPFPGLNYYTVFTGMLSAGYTAVRFEVPFNLPAGQTGLFTHGETLPGPGLTAAISERCGDFLPHNLQCGPIENSGPGQFLAKWKLDGNTGSNGCPLEPGKAYYFNVMMTNGDDCPAGACAVTLQNNHTP
ncbi:MAG: hypothetical protein ABIW82_10125 [Dokdonella sp.]